MARLKGPNTARGRSLRGERRRSVGGSLRPPRNYRDWLNVSPLPFYSNPLTLVVAKRKTLFDDRPVEISELTYVIKQDLASLNNQIASLQALTLSQHPKASRSKTDQEGEHNDNVCGRPPPPNIY